MHSRQPLSCPKLDFHLLCLPYCRILQGRDLIWAETELMKKVLRNTLFLLDTASSLLQATLPAPDPPTDPLTKIDPKTDPCYGWGPYGTNHELVHYKQIAAACASLLKDSFEKYVAGLAFSSFFHVFSSIDMRMQPGCSFRKHLWDVQAQHQIKAEIVASIILT
jgi:hypothetical protein